MPIMYILEHITEANEQIQLEAIRKPQHGFWLIRTYLLLLLLLLQITYKNSNCQSMFASSVIHCLTTLTILVLPVLLWRF